MHDTRPLTELPTLRPAQYVRATVTGEGAMLLDLRGRGRWFALSQTAAHWWRLLVEGADADQAACALAAHYGVDPTRVRSDVASLVTDLLGHGLLKVAKRSRRWYPW